MKMSRSQPLQAPTQLSLFDIEPVLPAAKPIALAPLTPAVAPPLAPEPFEPLLTTPEKLAQKKRRLPGSAGIEYVLRRSSRRSIGFLIEEDGLRVTAPRWVTIAEIENAIHSKLRWIVKKLDERNKKNVMRQNQGFSWRNGAKLPFLGSTITLQVGAVESVEGLDVAYDEPSATLTVAAMLALAPEANEKQLETSIQHWLRGEASRVFSQRMTFYAQKLGVNYHSLALSSASTLWGSCTAQGRIRLNWRLIHFPLHLIDYVIAHELSHLREMNHSPKFWATVKSVFPEFESARKSLNAHSPGISPTL